MDIDPNDKAMIDAYVDLESENKTSRAWVIWGFIAIASIIAIGCAVIGHFSDGVRIGLGVGGLIGILLFIAFASSKSIGSGDGYIAWGFWRWFNWW